MNRGEDEVGRFKMSFDACIKIAKFEFKLTVHYSLWAKKHPVVTPKGWS